MQKSETPTWKTEIWLTWLDFELFLSLAQIDSFLHMYLFWMLLLMESIGSQGHKLDWKSTDARRQGKKHKKSDYHCQPSIEFRTRIRALFTKARISSSNALRSSSGTFGSPLRAAVDSSISGLAISTSSS